jgi:hypothetical protein
VSTEDGSLQWVARAGYVERPKSGSVRGSGCNSPDLLGSIAEKPGQDSGRHGFLSGANTDEVFGTHPHSPTMLS